MANVFDYIFNIGGNFQAQINGMRTEAGQFVAEMSGAEVAVKNFTTTCMTFDFATNVIKNCAEGFAELTAAGVTLDTKMHELSAVAGVTGEGLQQIEDFARSSAKASARTRARRWKVISFFSRSCRRNWVNIRKRSARWATAYS